MRIGSNLQNVSAKFLLKLGIGLILVGGLIFLLKEIIILILASIFVAAGIFLLSISFKLWNAE